jgi:hypothetical protein
MERWYFNRSVTLPTPPFSARQVCTCVYFASSSKVMVRCWPSEDHI